VQICGTKGSVFLADENFRVWDFAEPFPADAEIHETLMQGSVRGLGANDPTAIHFDGHRRNFQEVVAAIQENRPCAVDAIEARKAVALINAVYQSARESGTRIVLSP
jgi:predicted dehydrogenase